MLAAAVPILCVMLLWVISMESRLPGIRFPSASSTEPNEPVLYRGHFPVQEVPLEVTGEWYQQPLGDRVSVATSTPGATLSLRFYGTEISVTTRVGPESGRLYAWIDGKPVPMLPADEIGSYIGLRDTQASDEPQLIASGLAQQEHVLTLMHGPTGVLAISAFDIHAQTPFPWAFALIYGFIAGALFLTLRALGIRLARHLGWMSRDPVLLTRQRDG